jgi:hypothetical protein
MYQDNKPEHLKGTCFLCKKEFSKEEMSAHLITCEKKLLSQAKSKKEKLFHLCIESKDTPIYWLYVDIPGKHKLSLLDEFLREIWLECCSHLSNFKIKGILYCSQPSDEEGPEAKEKSMDIFLEDLFSAGDKVEYVYDYGTSTELIIHVLSVSEEAALKKVHLVARNNPPVIKCVECGKKADLVCADCLWDDQGWLCEGCSSSHKCGPDYLLPVVNSPRVGQCAYTGELQ